MCRSNSRVNVCTFVYLLGSAILSLSELGHVSGVTMMGFALSVHPLHRSRHGWAMWQEMSRLPCRCTARTNLMGPVKHFPRHFSLPDWAHEICLHGGCPSCRCEFRGRGRDGSCDHLHVCIEHERAAVCSAEAVVSLLCYPLHVVRHIRCEVQLLSYASLAS